MRANRSMPAASVIPELGYEDVEAATDWLCTTFGFVLRWRIGGHRAQLAFGDGAIVVAERDAVPGTSHVMVRVQDADAHCAHAREHGARIHREPEDFPYGERQYEAEDLGGHRWSFSQTIADVDPREWGSVVGPAL